MKTRRRTRHIIVHHSLSNDVSAGTIRKWHMQNPRNWEDIGYHYVIRKDGSIEIGRQMDLVGAHSRGRNADSIGICLTGDFRINKPTDEQYESLRKLTDFLQKVYGDLAIIPHRTKYNPCPGVLFNWNKVTL